jgi:hypothetical protein
MSNKQMTAVEWLVKEISRDRVGRAIITTFLKEFEQAKEMEAKNQQKYDEMLVMLDGMCNVWNEVGINDYSMSNYMNLVQQLVKEAKEL